MGKVHITKILILTSIVGVFIAESFNLIQPHVAQKIFLEHKHPGK